jgi:hypothetical protein
MLGQVLARIFRVNTRSTLVALAAGMLIAILVAWLTGNAAWSVAAGLLLAVFVLAWSRTALIASLHAGRDLHVAGRDMIIAEKVHVAIGSIKYVLIRPARGSTITAVAAVFLVLWGTAYFGAQPGGRLEAIFPDYIRPAEHLFSGGSAGGNSASVSWNTAATFRETDQDGDSVTQTVSFAKPVPLSSLPDLSATAQSTACSTASSPQNAQISRDLVIPFRIVSTLDSSVTYAAPVSMAAGVFYNPNDISDGLGTISGGSETSAAPSFVELGESIQCDLSLNYADPETFTSAETVTLSTKGVPVDTYGWLVFTDVINGDNPTVSTEALGQTYAQLDFGSDAQGTRIAVTGPDVCTSSSTTQGPDNPQGGGKNFPPYLHLGGPVSPWEQCTGSFTGSPMF